MPGRPGSGRGDRAVPPGCAGVSVWRPAFVACASSAGSGDCSICGPCNNDGRSRTPGHSRSPGKTVDAVVLHGSPWRRFRRAGTTATEQGKRDLIYRGCSVGFFGPAQKARSAADGRGVPIPAAAPPCQSLSSRTGIADPISIGADERWLRTSGCGRKGSRSVPVPAQFGWRSCASGVGLCTRWPVRAPARWQGSTRHKRARHPAARPCRWRT